MFFILQNYFVILNPERVLMMANFAERLKLLRENKGLSQREFASEIGEIQQTVASWEKGKGSPSDDKKIRIANFFHTTLDYLLGRTDDPEPAPDYILAAHRKGGIDELPDEAQKQLDEYIEFLRNKYKK